MLPPYNYLQQQQQNKDISFSLRKANGEKKDI